jgi:hypothetical protein
MRLIAVIIFFVCVCLSPLLRAAEMVGGACTYEEFAGFCNESGTDDQDRVLVTFVGKVDGRAYTFERNYADRTELSRDPVPCKLMFIKEGTCTPCLLSVGFCGPAAWEFFQSRRAMQANGGCGCRR